MKSTMEVEIRSRRRFSLLAQGKSRKTVKFFKKLYFDFIRLDVLKVGKEIIGALIPDFQLLMILSFGPGLQAKQ